MLKAVADELEASDFSQTDLDERMRALVEKLQTKTGLLFGLVRAAITGSNVAPGLFETMHVLGKDVTLKRIKALQ
jgi:glutamyl-tRNA synthetase